jgi:cytochrome c oxidase subunit 2
MANIPQARTLISPAGFSASALVSHWIFIFAPVSLNLRHSTRPYAQQGPPQLAAAEVAIMRDRAPLDFFLHAYGPAARPTLWLGWTYAIICLLVCIIITGLLTYALMKRRSGDPEAILHGAAGLKGVFIGSLIATVILFGMAIYAFIALRSVMAPAQAPISIAVTGYDWWWRADYGGVTTANELHIPTGVPVAIRLNSADVIHAFWVPQLAGKTQMIPGVTTQQWLQANRPGVYEGQCTQFCGEQHAHMAFEVVAQSPSDYRAWLAAQAADAAAPQTALAQKGEDIFVRQCGGCHTVRGTPAKGAHAPDLTHLMSRRKIAAGLILNTPDNVMNWVEHAQDLKPGARMPAFNLTKDQRAALRAYLAGLS